MKIYRKLLFLLTALTVVFGSQAQEEMGKKERKAALKKITSTYRTWDKVQIDGKVQTDLLPVSASVRIYMENDRLIDVSVRAPFVGEAARIVITRDSVLAINKIKRTYCSEPIGDLMAVLPVGLPDLQDILLARVFVAGQGELSSRNADDCVMLSFPGEEGFAILPPAIQTPPLTYGFSTSPDGLLTSFVAISEEKGLAFNADFSYDFNQTVLAASLQRGERSVSAQLAYSDPNFKPKEPTAPAVGNNYKKVSPRQVIKF